MKLRFLKTQGPGASNGVVDFGSSDDLDLGLYFVRTLSNIFRWAPDALWDILARRTISAEDYQADLTDISESWKLSTLY